MFRFIIIVFIFLFHRCELYSDTLTCINSFGNFEKAASINCSRGEFIFVSDIQRNLIYKFTADGTLIKDFGGYGFGNSQFMTPISIDASNNLDIFVCDYYNNRIQRFDLNLNYIASFDFDTYNLIADMSRKIYYPRSIAFLNTSEIFVLCDATNYSIAKLKALEEVSLLFGNNSVKTESLFEPVKIVCGINLQLWVLDKVENKIKNFDNFGTYIGELGNIEDRIISIAFYKECLYIATDNSIMIYDLTSKKFNNYLYYRIDTKETPVDIALLGNDTILILTEKQVYSFK